MISNLGKQIIAEGGDIVPILIPSTGTNGMGMMNPSIVIDGKEILVNLRWVDYSFFHSEKGQKFWSRWGPLTYIHPENDLTLKTINYLCKLDYNTLEVVNHAKIDTSKLDIPPVWEFHGLEDARLVKWDGKLYGIGVRRDVKPNGEGRMQYQEIEYKFEDDCIPCSKAKEISRNRIQPPIDPNSYCEKNWMPIPDMPHHFVKWTNPTEVVKVNLEDNTSTQFRINEKFIHIGRDLRGGSQVIKWGDGWLAITHELEQMETKHEVSGIKDAKYLSRFVFWDKDWNITKTSEDFLFMDARIEFTTGLAEYNDEFVLATFGWADCSAYTAKIPKKLINKLLVQSW